MPLAAYAVGVAVEVAGHQPVADEQERGLRHVRQAVAAQRIDLPRVVQPLDLAAVDAAALAGEPDRARRPVERRHLRRAVIGDHVAQIDVALLGEAIAVALAAVVPAEVEPEAQRAQRQHRKVEPAPVPGDDVRPPLAHEVGEVGHHPRLVFAFAERADPLHGSAPAQPHHADDDRAAGIERRERSLDAGGRLGRRKQLSVRDGLDIEDEVGGFTTHSARDCSASIGYVLVRE